MKKAMVLALAILVGAAVTTAALAKPSAQASASATQAVNCNGTFDLPFITPLTGGAGFLGTEQASWAKYAVKTLAPKYGLKVKLLLGDTPVEQGPAPALALAQKYIADKKVVAVLGPSTSGNAGATAKPFFAAGIAEVSPSATHTDLTYATPGDPLIGTPAFFRVVARDDQQGSTDAKFMTDKLHVSKVVSLDFQEPYSVGLSAQVDAALKKAGVTVIHLSAPNTTTDYSAYVTKVPSDTDVVFFPTQKPGDAQTMAQQLLEQGKKAKVFGGDGSNDPSEFKVPGSYLSNFAAPIDLFPYNKAIIAGWQKDNPGKQVGSFGPPTYGAVQVIFEGIKAACAANHGTIAQRRDVIRRIKRVKIKNFILGGNFAFSTKSNDPLNRGFYIFQIQSNGSYKLVQSPS
jgi:branched-chain amino acid transport system substrate-binding protein